MAKSFSESGSNVGRLCGLVLAGGHWVRLGRDKGELEYHGVPQVRWALRLLEGFCAGAFVSLRSDQAGTPAYADLPLIVDSVCAGPATGLAAAMQRMPGAAWLVIAADMPLLDTAVLAKLVTGRDRSALATAYRRHDGTAEPLCAIWEPTAAAALLPAAGGGRGVSLRRLLEAGPARLLEPDDESVLTSVNTAADDTWVRQRLAGHAGRVM